MATHKPWTSAGWGATTGEHDGTWQDAATSILCTLIPLLIADFRDRPDDEVHELAVDAAGVTLAHGESFIYHSGNQELIVAGGNATAVQIAALAVLSADGVDFLGHHWCAWGCRCCIEATTTAMSAVDQILDDLESSNQFKDAI